MADKSKVSNATAYTGSPGPEVDWAGTEAMAGQMVKHLEVFQAAYKVISLARQAQGDAEYLQSQVAERQAEILVLDAKRTELVDGIRVLASTKEKQHEEMLAGFESARKDEEKRLSEALKKMQAEFVQNEEKLNDDLSVLKERNKQVLELVETNEKRFNALRESLRELRVGTSQMLREPA